MVGNLLNWITLVDHLTSGKKPITSVPKLEIQQNALFISFAHYSSNQQLDEIDKKTIRQIASLTDQFVITTNAPNLFDSECQANLLSQEINRGFDLAMHRDVLAAISKSSTWPEYLILTNNSLVWDDSDGFKRQIHECIEFSKRSGANVIFMSDSLQPSYHLQSYFVFANTSHKKIQELLDSTYSKCRNWRLKRAAVFFGEKRILTGLSSFSMTQVLYPINSLTTLFVKNNSISPERISQISRIVNPNQHLATEMIQLGAHFQKKTRNSGKNKLTSRFLDRVIDEQ